jgi:hypothetical protein
MSDERSVMSEAGDFPYVISHFSFTIQNPVINPLCSQFDFNDN